MRKKSQPSKARVVTTLGNRVDRSVISCHFSTFGWTASWMSYKRFPRHESEVISSKPMGTNALK